MNDTILGYGDLTGYTYNHITKISEKIDGWIHVDPLCGQGIRSRVYIPKDLDFVRHWHILYNSLPSAVLRITDWQPAYSACSRCLATANHIIDKEMRSSSDE